MFFPPKLPAQRNAWVQRLALFCILVAVCSSCHRPEDASIAYERARTTFVHGDLVASQTAAEEGYRRFKSSNPEWAWKFKILEAESMLWRGMYLDVVNLLQASPPDRSTKIQVLGLLGAAKARLGSYSDAERYLGEARQLCMESLDRACGGVSRAEGVLATERRDLAKARRAFTDSMVFARSHGDQLLEATALLNLGAVALLDGHFDEAADWSNAAYRISSGLQAEDLSQNALGNLGWAYYRLGDKTRALDLFLQAEKHAARLGDLSDEASWLTDAGYVYMDTSNFSLAQQSFQRGLNLEKQVNSKDDVYNIRRVLARLDFQTGEFDKAAQDADDALEIARETHNHADELYPLLVQGQIAAQRRGYREAQSKFEEVKDDQASPVFLKWEAEHSLAQLYETQKQFPAADREYRVALSTFEAARADVRHEDFQLSFLTNAEGIYDDYVSFLVEHHHSDEALRWADYSRARTLAEGLELLPKTGDARLKPVSLTAPAFNLKNIAARANGTILFYWLGEKQSYLWAISEKKTQLFSLPRRSEINSVAERYRQSLIGPQISAEYSNPDGRALYEMLVSPAKDLLARGGKVFIIPDGSLNNLNFETLIVAQPKPHYWIEDADVVNASSLRVLAASFGIEKRRSRKLLLVGESIVPSKDYPTLPKAAEQMATVEKHFAPAQEQIYRGAQATPAAYLASNPEQFSYIHFVAHGTANRLSPLDSAILLSGSPGGSFKLYARDIVQRPLNADLVTISACYSAGERSYSGEGLVGLAWAFLRAGAHNVIAALWDVTDTPAEQLMERFYEELDKGQTPDEALRSAKLSLLHEGTYGNPFYWAPFQLYTGSFATHPRNGVTSIAHSFDGAVIHRSAALN
ncbi:MAG TPA: CHAT domain-containing tetratricopeptide repeat protein [Terriglobales bacterium]